MAKVVVLKKDTSDFLDSTRGICSILVMLTHLLQFFVFPIYGVKSLLSIIVCYTASCAVMAFFVLSGYVIALSINNAVAGKKEKWFLDFLARRIARIYPPLIFSLILTLLVVLLIYFFEMHGKYSFRLDGEYHSYVARESINFVWQEYVSTFFMLPVLFGKYWPSLNMNGPLWSISYEFWMYIVAALIAYGVIEKKICLLGLTFACVIIAQVLLDCVNLQFFYCAIVWLLGAMVFSLRNIGITSLVKRLIAVAGLLCLIMMIFLVLKTKTVFIPYNGFYSCFFQFLFIMLLLSLIFYFKVWRLFVFRIFKFSARYSYTLYVIHFPLILISFSLLHLIFLEVGFILKAAIIFALMIIIIYIAAFFSKWLENSRHYYQSIQILSAALKSFFTKSKLDPTNEVV